LIEISGRFLYNMPVRRKKQQRHDPEETTERAERRNPGGDDAWQRKTFGRRNWKILTMSLLISSMGYCSMENSVFSKTNWNPA
jgi:hypothetical protein